MFVFISTILVLLGGFIALQPSFSLALFGDDWLAFWRYLQMVGPKSSGEWNLLTYFLTPYGAQDIIMGLLQNIYGYSSSLYFITSYVLRMLAALSLYPLVYYLTKSKSASFAAALFFAVTVTGLDATNWVFNMPSYLSIAFFNIFLFLFLSSRYQKDLKRFLLSGLFFYLAYVTAPIRMTGLLPFVFVLELIWLILNFSKINSKKVILRFLYVVAIFIFISKTGHSNGVTNDWVERFQGGISMALSMLSVGRFDFLFYPIVTFGSMLIPDFLASNGQTIAHKSTLLEQLLFLYLLYLPIATLILKSITTSKGLFRLVAATGLIWTGIVFFITTLNLKTFNSSNYVSLLSIGGFILIISLLAVRYLHKNKLFVESILLALAWSILSFFSAWWWSPNTIYPTTYRYLIASAAGLAILISIFLGVSQKKTRNLIYFLFLILIGVQIYASRMYTNQLLLSHNQKISNSIWSKIPYNPGIGKDKLPFVYYFEGDGTNGGILHDVITFGFPPHMALIYHIRAEDGGIPVPLTDPKELKSVVTDGKAFAAYGYPLTPVNLDRIYAFRLDGPDDLIDITDQTRASLKNK